MTNNTESYKLTVPPSDQYDDQTLYGNRREAIRLAQAFKQDNCSECILFGINAYADKSQWSLKDLVGLDKRILTMLEARDIQHAYPLQRYCWPHVEKGRFPIICISPDSSGKTYAQVLYALSKCISSIPVSRTDELLAYSDSLSSFSLERKNNQKSTILSDELGDIDQDAFDFNALGKDAEQNSTLPTTSSVNGEQSENASSWATDADLDLNPEQFTQNPKYVIICSSQQSADNIQETLHSFKAAAYSLKDAGPRVKTFPPVIRVVGIHHDDEKLALRCHGSDILIATPAALVKCFKLKLLTFKKCLRVFFDDLDLTLQIHNASVRELIKFYLAQTHDDGDEDKIECQICFFSKKWTDLVKQFSCNIFTQRILIFGSMIEASIYANLRFDLEIPSDERSKLIKLMNCLDCYLNSNTFQDRITIVCKSNEEATKLHKQLEINEYNVKHITDDDAASVVKFKAGTRPIFVVSDFVLEEIFEIFNRQTILIHYSLPDDWLVFDQRFRTIYLPVQANDKGLVTVVFLSSDTDVNYMRKLYDIVSRSAPTLPSTKKELRDYINKESKVFCWRWASIGVCKLEKLSREDRLGSYCFGRHALVSSDQAAPVRRRWPTDGQFSITITSLISPNEFYFWFEAHRSINSLKGVWKRFESTGREFMNSVQKNLDILRDTPPCSVPLDQFKKGKIYGIYFPQEGRVDRITLLEDISRDDIRETLSEQKPLLRLVPDVVKRKYILEYSKQVQVVRTDYGSILDVYLRNIFFLPKDLESIEPQCYRGFYVGVKPAGGEPNWVHKAKMSLYNSICVDNLSEIRAWLRLSNNNCFWFENILTLRKLKNFDKSEVIPCDPYQDLLTSGLADPNHQEPGFLKPSMRLKFRHKWESDKFASLAGYAHLNTVGRDVISIFVMKVNADLSLIVRKEEDNKAFIKMEDEILEQFKDAKIKHQRYLDVGVYCLVKLPSMMTVDRCRILEKLDDNQFKIKCLDHGEVCVAAADDLYQISEKFLRRLPFQAIDCTLLGLNEAILGDSHICEKLNNAIYELTWNGSQMLKTFCKPKEGSVELFYISEDKDFALPAASRLQEMLGREDLFEGYLVTSAIKVDVIQKSENSDEESHDQMLNAQTGNVTTDLINLRDGYAFFNCYLGGLLRKIAQEELEQAAKHSGCVK